MVAYRRNKQQGGTFFFTVTLQDRKSKLLTEHFQLLKSAINEIKAQKPFTIKSMVVLPDHLHSIFELPHSDHDYPVRWRKIKTLFTQKLLTAGVKLKKDERGECNLWQRRYWEHTIRNEKDYDNHVNYIHFNPVKHNLVKNVSDWPYSTLHAYMKSGILSKNLEKNFEGVYGE